MAAKLSIRVTGMKPAIGALVRIGGAELIPQIDQILLEAVRPVMQDAAARAPMGKTGNLRRALKVEVSKYKHPRAYTAVDIKIAPHAYLVESGTRKSAARPFFRPAVLAGRSQAVETVTRGLTGIYDGLLQSGQAELVEGGVATLPNIGKL